MILGPRVTFDVRVYVRQIRSSYAPEQAIVIFFRDRKGVSHNCLVRKLLNHQIILLLDKIQTTDYERYCFLLEWLYTRSSWRSRLAKLLQERLIDVVLEDEMKCAYGLA